MESQTIYHKYEKADVPSLPRALFAGRIVVVNGESQAQKAVDALLSEPRVGIDTETRPNFKRGDAHKVSLLQVSTDDVCFLFRLNRTGLPECVVRLLESERVQKVGLALNDDFRVLRQRCASLEPHNVVDLQRLAAERGLEERSLQMLYANLLGGFISKRQQLSNWEADSLTEAQQLYAATDAWACLRIQDRLTNTDFHNDDSNS